MIEIPPLLLALTLAAAPAPASTPGEPDWGGAATVRVDLSSFKFSPRTIELKAGRPVLLRLVNAGSGDHDFTAREFFAAAMVRPADSAKLRKGAVEIGGRQTAEIALVPRAGRFPLRCGHAFHSTLGMKGAILVR